MDRRERIIDAEEHQRMILDGFQGRLWTALPGIVQSFDAQRMVCNVQPSIKGSVLGPDGSVTPVNMPMLLDCPVVFPGGGGCTLTFPVSAGDECLMIFSSRCIDSWWLLGGVQGQAEFRMHNLSDGFALVGVRSQPRKFTVDTSGVQLRTDDGLAYLEIDPATHAMTFQTSGSLTINAASLTINANISSTGTLTNNGKNISSTHTHGGVQTGGGSTGVPN